MAAQLRECEGDQYGGVYFYHGAVRLRACESVSVYEQAHTCVRVSLRVPAALATAESIQQMITISTNLPAQPGFGHS